MDHRIQHLQQLHQQAPRIDRRNQGTPPDRNFASYMAEAAGLEQPLKVSKHAEKRLQDRNITVQESTWKKLNERMAEARNKGIQDSLVVLKDAALIVSATNNTVITAMNREEAQSQIFTNINGTILIDE
ncbi:TIGR02530 family flagellar biosynthesis protein [Bacillus marinisedimentorum]|uniref:TIGR02530 family flagellar biosynthesis protein n=1 Tax=Bacillus marinisedimentorum TaxID=1821260 RepID=UPI0007DEFC05|nr:TIGR02530 family flagellar biosynthesis protein [Bacillus marinisedimentorum]